MTEESALAEEKYVLGSIGSGNESMRLYEPRSGKPEMYMLYVNEELIEAFGTAHQALIALREQAMDAGDRVEVKASDGDVLAEKKVVTVQNTTNWLQPTRKVPQLLMADNLKRDLVAEGRDPADPFAEGKGQESSPGWRSQLAQQTQSAVGARPDRDWFKELEALSAKLPKEGMTAEHVARLSPLVATTDRAVGWRAQLVTMKEKQVPDRAQDTASLTLGTDYEMDVH
jgi:hypothetical protein